ncbi:MAG: DUF2188 domain-containing protein [Acidimicrobiales bacterium]
MSRDPSFTIEPHAKGRWAVQKDGTQRATRMFDRQTEAEAWGRAQARNEGTLLVVKGAGGRIRHRDSHRTNHRTRGG